jgi:hypothetical protein
VRLGAGRQEERGDGAPSAHQLVVSARTASGTSLFVVDSAAAAWALNPSRTVDGSVWPTCLHWREAGADALLGAEGGALPHIEEASTSPPLCCAPKLSAR